MAQVDPSIALGIRPVQIENPANAMARVLQLRSAQQQGEAAAFDMEQRRSGAQRQAKMYQLLDQQYATPEDREGALLRGGYVDQATKLAKDRRDNAKTEVETKAKQFEIAGKKLDLIGQTLGHLRTNPSLQSAALALDHLVTNQVMSPEEGAKYKQQFTANPSSIAAIAEQAYRAALSAKDQLASFQTRNTGGTTDTLKIDPVTGQVATANSVRNTQSPDSAASVAATMRGQNMLDARGREANAISREKNQIDSTGNVFKTETDLRKEFADLPEVKRYKAAFPSFNSIKQAAKSNNPQADINLIYGVAKLYDPESVVREGEYGTIANSQAIPEWLKGQAQRLAGGGRLTEETKRQILQQADIRINGYEAEYQKAVGAYENIAKGRNANPSNVIPSVGRVVDFGSLK
jgi:hypothetical protein